MKKAILLVLLLLVVVSGAGLAGAIPSQQRWDGTVEAHSSVTFWIYFSPGSAEVSIDGDNDTDLDLYVYNLEGTLVSSRTSLSDAETASWQARGGWYHVEVRNLGDVYNQFVLWTN